MGQVLLRDSRSLGRFSTRGLPNKKQEGVLLSRPGCSAMNQPSRNYRGTIRVFFSSIMKKSVSLWGKQRPDIHCIAGLRMRKILCHPFHSFIHSSMALQPFVGPWPFLQFRNHFYTDGRIPWTSQGRYLHTGQHKRNKRTHRHPCLEWDSNSQLQRSNKRRQFML
jgi:hypothetical protein